ncbi:unnamed protein product, partial [marine sediment metagenome]
MKYINQRLKKILYTISHFQFLRGIKIYMNISIVLPNTAPLPFWLEKYKILSSKPYPPSPPLGLLSVAAYIENHGYNVNVIDNNVERLDQEKLIKEILKTDPKVVAFHTTSM